MPESEPEVVDVMLGDVGGEPINTLMLERTDLIVPLERDADGDPFQDDEVWLCTEDGTLVQRHYSSDEEVEEDEDNRLLLYRFGNLRYGVYSIWTKVGGQLVEIHRGLEIRRDGVFMGDEELGETREGGALAPEPDHAADLDDDVELADDSDSDDDADLHPSDRQVDQSDDEHGDQDGDRGDDDEGEEELA